MGQGTSEEKEETDGAGTGGDGRHQYVPRYLTQCCTLIGTGGEVGPLSVYTLVYHEAGEEMTGKLAEQRRVTQDGKAWQQQ